MQNHALILACGAGHVEAVKLLLASGASVNHTNSQNMNCLDVAIDYKQTSVAVALVQHSRYL